MSKSYKHLDYGGGSQKNNNLKYSKTGVLPQDRTAE